MYSDSVFLKTELCYMFLKAQNKNKKIKFVNPDWKCFKFGFQWGKFWPLFKENCFKKEVSDLWKKWPLCPKNYF